MKKKIKLTRVVWNEDNEQKSFKVINPKRVVINNKDINEFIQQELDHQREEIVEELEGIKIYYDKSTGEYVEDGEVLEDETSALYNQAIDDAIEQINK